MRTKEEIAHSIGLMVDDFNQLQRVFRNNIANHGAHRFFRLPILSALVEAETAELLQRCTTEDGELINEDLYWEATQHLSNLCMYTLPKSALLYICNEHLDVCETALAQFTEQYGNDDLHGYYFADIEALVTFVLNQVKKSKALIND
jgi:hypothetical protein